MTAPQPADSIVNVPTALVYDAFVETANQLAACCTRLSDTAFMAEGRERC
ncbi:hypothetical protein AB0E67_32670 [Streptomyces sp. NPDC032161]